MSKVFVIPDVHLKPWMFEKAAEKIAEGNAAFIQSVDIDYIVDYINKMGKPYMWVDDSPIWASPSKMTLDKDNYIFIPYSNIDKITVKKFALLNSKVKRISIDTKDGKSHKLYARVEEKDFPYHKDNFNAFVEKYA